MRERKEKRRWGLMVFIILIMIGTSFSVFFFGFAPASDTANYKGIKFTSNGNFWIARINAKDAAFSYLPAEVEYLMADEGMEKKLKNKFEIDLTYDFNSSFAQTIALAQHQMGLTLASYNVYLRKGFTSNTTFNFPIITCDTATDIVPVIYIMEGNQSKIRLQGNCVIAEASSQNDVIKLKDRMLYSMLGVIK